MSTNADDGRTDQRITNEPEENIAVTAYDRSLSALEFDREHGDEVEFARRELDAQAETARHAA